MLNKGDEIMYESIQSGKEKTETLVKESQGKPRSFKVPPERAKESRRAELLCGGGEKT